MNSIIPSTIRFAGGLLATILITSCVHLQPKHREFQTVAEYAHSDDFADGLSADEALKKIPKEPDFQQMKFERKVSPSLLQSPAGPYRVGPGDILDIEIAEDADSRTKTRVMPDGMLYYNVARGINVKGKTLREISTLLSHQLEDDYVNPIVTVNVADADSQRFWMLGQVQTPGTFPIKKPTTLIEAISQAGGMLSNRDGVEVSNPEAADLERAILIRNGDLIPVNFEKLIREGDMSQNVYVRGGDYIFVPSLTARSIYVLGAINRPGPVFYETGATLISAVSAAGGPKIESNVTRALIIRGGTHTPKVAVVNLRSIMKGYEPDLRLQGGDIVWVPKGPWSKLDDYVEAVLVTAAQAVAVQEGLGVLGTTRSAGVTINAGGN